MFEFVKDYFENCRSKQDAYTTQIMKGESLHPSFGPVVDLFLDGDKDTLEILGLLGEKIKDATFCEDFLIEKRKLLEREAKYLIEKIVHSEPMDVISIYQLKSNFESQDYTVEDWKNAYTKHIDALDFLKQKGATNTLCFLTDMYDSYLLSLDKFKDGKSTKFEDLYRDDERKILNTSNYQRYGLIQCTDDFVLKEGTPPKIYDTKKDTHLLVEFIPNTFFSYLKDLRNANAFDLALRPNYDICDYGVRDISVLLEGYTRWNDYKSGLDKIPPLTKFFDEQRENDFIVIQSDSIGIVFEEVLEDFDIYSDDTVVTQGVHFKYKDGKIVHLDHEYFFYSLDDFADKQVNLWKKGAARKRFKTFKIDEANLPYDEDPKKNIVYKTLHTFFKKHELIDEIFEKMKN